MIPKIVHFAYFYPRHFPLYGCLAVKSAQKFLRPEQIFVYRAASAPELEGEWWEKAKDAVTIIKVQPPTEIWGNPLNHPAHQADVFRLRTLLEQGGIYLDFDTMCCRAFDHLLEHKCVLGHQTPDEGYGLCNAAILAEKQSGFLQIWLEQYRSFRSTGADEFWDEHSVRLPLQLARNLQGADRGLLHTEPHTTFFNPGMRDEELAQLFEQRVDFPKSLSHHLWAGFSYKRYLSRLHPEHILQVDTTYNLLARQVIDLNACRRDTPRPSAVQDTAAPPAAEDFSYENRKYRLTGRNASEGILASIRKQRTFVDAELLEFIRGRGLAGTYVDVGANIGNHSLFFLRETRCTRLVAVEANAQLVPHLEANLTADEQGRSRCEIFKAVIACRNKVYFNPADTADEPYGSYVSSICLGEESYPAEARTLDQLLGLRGNVAVLRIGIESRVIEVLKSGNNLLRRQHPEVCVRVTYFTEEEVCRVMSEYGYLPLAAFPGGMIHFARFPRYFLWLLALTLQLPQKISSRAVWRLVRLQAMLTMRFPLAMFGRRVPRYYAVSTGRV